jgi:uncharacterized integral membrane protein
MTEMELDTEVKVYQGQFGEFTIDENDRQEVIIYRTGLSIAALALAIAGNLILWQATNPLVLQALTILFFVFALGLGASLLTIHIYLRPLHRTLQGFWLIGFMSALILAWQNNQPLALFVYNHPINILGVGFIFAALTGIYFKEAFCFNRLETKFLTFLVPFMLIGHLFGLLSVPIEKILLSTWVVLFIIFAFRKTGQPIAADIGDKSVFAYLKRQEKP